MKNPVFRDMMKATIINIAQKNFDATDVEADLQAWAGRREPYMPAYYERFGDTSWAWKSNIASTAAFFQKRYDHIIPALLLHCAADDV